MFPLARFQVEDDSMRPTLDPGDYVLVNRWAYRLRSPSRGDLVVLRDPQAKGRFLVKRIAEPSGPNRWSVLSDNPDRGRDSRTFGPIEPQHIIGKVWMRLRP